MSTERVEQGVAAFLDRRVHEPDLTPEAYVEGLDALREEVLAAIRRTLGIEQLLASAAEPRPESIGPYRVEQELGRGAMGVVYAVEREGRRYALKLWSPTWALGRAGHERFERETRTLALLDHPGIVRVHDSGVEARCPYLVMDLVQGEPLSQVAKPMQVRRAVTVVAALARAVDAAHQAGILHRDVKPQNVVLAPDDRPILLDFGLVAAEGEETLTATGALLGTPRYMAPEQARGQPAERGSDVFALGLILAELLCGEPLRSAGSHDTMLREAAGETRVPALARAHGRGLRRVLRATLARNPGRRPEASALAADLAGWLAGRAATLRPPSWSARTSDRVHAQPAWLALPIALIVLGVLIVQGWGAASRRATRAEARFALAEEHTDLALCAWMLGARIVVQAELAAALGHDERHPVARALSNEERPEAWRDLVSEADPGPGPGTLATLQAHALRATDPGAALAQVARQRSEFPRSASLACVEALLQRDLGAAAEERRAWQDAVALAPASGPMRSGLAESILAGGDVEAGVAEAVTAGDLYAAQRTDPRVMLTVFLDADPVRLRATLEEILVERPGTGWLWYCLGYSHDMEHQLAGAERGYRKAFELDPTDLKAVLNLAHLVAGAQMGVCQECDEAYADQPRFLDPERATRLLLVALDHDRGRSRWVHDTMIDTAMDLQRRSPAVGTARALLERAEALLAGGDPGAAARERIEELATRMRWATGR